MTIEQRPQPAYLLSMVEVVNILFENSNLFQASRI